MRVYGPVLALTAMLVTAVSAQAEQPRASLYQTLIEDVPRQSDVEMVSHQQFVSMEQRLAAMEARLASVETVNYAFDEGVAAAPAGNGTCGGTCCGTCNDCWCSVCPGCTFNVEYLLFRGYNSEVNADNNSYEDGSRYEIGYMNACGASWRARYFEHENPDFNTDDDYLQLEYIDVEYAGRFTLGCNWRGELSAGVRWAEVDTDNDNSYSDSLGPVLGLHLRGPCWCGLSTYGNLRQSYQFGQENGRDTPSFDFGHFAVSEVQLGLEYQTCACGGVAFARSFVEAQSWRGIDDQDDFADVGLMGFGFALGLTR
jgi:hypothetical protein